MMESAPTNLLFITTDQQRFDSLPCYGLDFMQTPNLDRLAAEGVVFERCYTPAPVCVPCRAAWMSGQWPSTTGVLSNGQWLDESTPTWPALMSAAGFRTAGIGKMHFMPWDISGGFDERVIAEDKRHVYLPDDHYQYLRAHGIERPHPTSNPHYFEWVGASIFPHDRKFHVDGYTGDRAAEWLQQHGDSPFAVWVSFAGPHDPYDPPEDMADMYYDADIPEPVGGPEELANKPKGQGDKGAGSLNNSMFRIDPSTASAEDMRRWRAHYYANISLIDEGIGKMLAALETRGTLDNTLIIFTSDHGDALGDHGLPFKGYFYESMAHVPMIVRGPHTPDGSRRAVAGGRCASLVSGLDVVATFFDVCGVEAPATIQGTSLGPLLDDPSLKTREVTFCEITGRAMVTDGRWKYCHYVSGEAELYDLDVDPSQMEIENLAGQTQVAYVESRLRAKLLEHWLQNQRTQQMATSVPNHPFRLALEKAYREERDQA
ncbi:MAG: sulfatase-like hydrolase/transferase [Candidatus Latescibacterota bacterium]|nr:sulfatase-like hydrolase/transferase [Candidatus Latescibacterota bacterium]